jgi:hypothetical protein
MKKMTTVILVVILTSTLFMLSAKQSMVKAYPSQPGQSGYDFTYNDGWMGPDGCCLCVHASVWTDDDCCVGLGLSAIYDYCQGNWGNYVYQLGQWYFDSGVGTQWNRLADPSSYEDTPNWSLFASHMGTVVIDGCCSYYYNDTAPQWTDDSGPASQYNQMSNRFCYPGPGSSEYQYIEYSTMLGVGSLQYFEKDGTIFYMNAYESIIACNGGGGYSESVWS